jgi:hypothetical protein
MPRSADDSKPERHGKPWYSEEEKFVLEQIQKDVAIWLIADQVKRTPSGVSSHLKEIAFRNIQGGVLIEDASKLVGIPVQDIQEYIARKELLSKNKVEKKLEQQLKFPLEKEETLLSVAIEIRDLLKDLLKNKTDL